MRTLEDPRPKRRWWVLLTLVALVVYAILATTVWIDDQFRPQWDAACYVLTAQALATGEGYTYAGQPFFLRPPGTAYLISLFLAEDGSFDPLLLNRLIMVAAATSVAAIYFALSRYHRPWMALGVALLVGTCPVVVSWFNYVLSEFPYLTLVFLGIGLLKLSARRERGWWFLSLLAVLVLGAAFYCRSLAGLLLPAMLFVGWSEDRGRQHWRSVLPVLLFFALVLPWILHSRAAAQVAERPSEQLLLFDYATAIFREYPGDPDSALVPLSGWVQRFGDNARAICTALAEQMIGTRSAALGYALMGLILIGALRVLRRGAGLLDWYALSYLGVMLAYFTFERRLIVPWMPVAYRYLLAACAGPALPWDSEFRGSRRATAAGGVLLALLLGANLWRLPESLDPFHEGRELTRRGMVKADTDTLTDWITNSTPEDAVILCNQAPVLSLRTGRACYTWRYTRKPLLQKYQPDYVVLEGPVPRWFSVNVQKNSDFVIRLPDAMKSGGLSVFRVRKPLPALPR